MDFINNLNIDQWADLGFGILVAGICVKTLFTDKNALKKQRELWREELKELEGSLKELISAAGNASKEFDISIKNRQDELSSLLLKVENTIEEAKSINSSVSIKEQVQTKSSQTKTINNINSKDETEVIDPPWAKLQDQVVIEKNTKDENSSSLKYKTLSSLANYSQKGSKVELKPQVDAEKLEQDKLDYEIFQQTSIVDIIAFKVAKRLLLAGKELHVVARKLDLPVSEIRLLDGLLRNYAQKENKPLPKALEEKEIRRVRGIVRDVETVNGQSEPNFLNNLITNNTSEEDTTLF